MVPGRKSQSAFLFFLLGSNLFHRARRPEFAERTFKAFASFCFLVSFTHCCCFLSSGKYKQLLKNTFLRAVSTSAKEVGRIEVCG